MALLLNRSDVQQVLTMAKAIDAVEAAFGELANATAEMPPRTVMIDPAVGGWIAYMPAYIKTSGSLGIKAVTVYKDNPTKFDLTTTIGTILVQNNQTGEVVAAMDGGYLTAVRTGAVSGVATRHMARKNSKVGGVLGAGVQARQQAIAIAEASNIDTILTFSLDDDASRQEFADWVSDQTGLETRLAKSGEALCRESDIVALATTAANPIVDASWWKPGAHINAIGSHAPGVRELDTATIQRARIICDQLEACKSRSRRPPNTRRKRRLLMVRHRRKPRRRGKRHNPRPNLRHRNHPLQIRRTSHPRHLLRNPRLPRSPSQQHRPTIQLLRIT